MRSLKIYCKNCDGKGIINHPKRMFCPFCSAVGYKDIEYELNHDAKRGKDE